MQTLTYHPPLASLVCFTPPQLRCPGTSSGHARCEEDVLLLFPQQQTLAASMGSATSIQACKLAQHCSNPPISAAHPALAMVAGQPRC
jgi:hypothetical protein